ncbi:MAG: ASCH domain-containing protein [Polyangiales bacterium]
MRALSIQQPWAQLMVRGATHHEVRTWTTDYRGRLAIHASAKAPVYQALADAQRDLQMRQRFEREGWRDRDALLALPRSAVIGTVELKRIVRVADLDFKLDVVFEPDETDYAWEFADAIEIEPVIGVHGKLKLWTLDAEAAQVVTAAEARVRASGHRHPQPPESIDFARALRRLQANEPFWRQYRAFVVWLLEETAEDPWPPKLTRFQNRGFERLFRRAFAEYCATHQSRGKGADAEVAIDRRIPEMRSWFGDRQWMKRSIFEALLRKAMYYEGANVDPVDEEALEGDGPSWDPWSALEEFRELNQYVERFDGSGIAERIVDPHEDFPKHAGGRPKKNGE